MMKKQRDISLDVVRCLACVMVIVMHSPMPDIGISGSVLSTISLLTAPCIGLFFMVSGALLLPAKDGVKGFLTRRFSKIVWPTIFWSLFYIGVKTVGSSTVYFSDLLHQLLSLPFSAQGHGVMWFMYVLSGLYLLTPILSPWIRTASQKELQFYLLLWLLTMSFPLINGLVAVNETSTGILYYFAGYAGYYVLGYYLRCYPIARRYCVPLFLVPIFSATGCKILHVAVDFYQVFWYLSVLTVMMCVAWFTLIHGLPVVNRMHAGLRRLVVDFSNCSFGIYLVHIFVMRNVLWNDEYLLKSGG